MKFPFFHLKRTIKMTVLNNEKHMNPAPVATLPTLTGKTIEILNPKEEDIDIEDIANGLAMECRFGNQINRHYSVAQHSILVSALAPKSLKREALLHDAAEAYLGDITKPWKNLLASIYTPIEFRFEQVIFQKYGLDISRISEVKPFDMLAYQMERDFLRHGKPEKLLKALGNAGMIIGGNTAIWPPLVSKMEFLRIFTELFNDRSRMEGQK
jgi:hypothetical protein